RRVQLARRVHALVVVAAVDRLGVRDRLAVDQDGAALRVEARVEHSGVAAVALEVALLEHLDDARRREERDEHHHDEERDATQFSVHGYSSTSLGCARTESDTRMSSATMTQFATSDEPPAARNGVVSPVRGM